MAAPTLQAEGSAVGATSGTLSPTIPTHQADDILILAVVFWGPNTVGDAAAVPTPSGWTSIVDLATPATTPIDGRLAFFWRRAAAAGETVSVTRGASWDTGTDTQFAARVYVIRGCITTGDPWDEADPTVVYNTANQPVDAVTVSGTERLVIQFLSAQDDWATNPTAPAGWTAGTVQESTSGTDAGFFDFRKDNVSASTGADTPTVPVPTQGYYAYVGISFKPPATSQSLSITQADETDAAVELRVPKLVAATTVNSAVTLDVDKKVTIVAAVEVDAAQALSTAAAQHINLPIATEADAAQALTYAKTLTPAVTVNSAVALDVDKLVKITPATEVDSAPTLTELRTLPVATTVNTAVALTFFLAHTLTAATEADAAQTLSVIKPIIKAITAATEVDAAQTLSQTGETLPVTTEADSAVALAVTKPIFKTLPVALETDIAQDLSISHAGAFVITPATEVDTAQALTFLQPHFKTITPATEVDTAQTLSQTGETLAPAIEVGTAVTLVVTKTIFKAIVPAVETDQAQDLSIAHAGTFTIAAATEINQAQPLTFTKPIFRTVAPATEVDTPLALTKFKSATLVTALEADAAVALNYVKLQLFFLPPATESDSAVTLPGQRRMLAGRGEQGLLSAGDPGTIRRGEITDIERPTIGSTEMREE